VRRPLALLVLLIFALGLLGSHLCEAKAPRSAAPHCGAMARHSDMPGMGSAPGVRAAGHGCCGLPGKAGDPAQCERACCLLAVLYIPSALAPIGPSDTLPLANAELHLSLFTPSIEHIPLA